MPSDLLLYFAAVSFLWLVLLTFFIVRQYIFFKKLSDFSGKKENLIKTINSILDQQKANNSEIEDLKKLFKFLKTKEIENIQRVGLIKYNPFAEMGGDHSFSLAVLNGKSSGFILTALHTRDRTRLYVKEIKAGKSNIDLSDHENKAIEAAEN